SNCAPLVVRELSKHWCFPPPACALWALAPMRVCYHTPPAPFLAIGCCRNTLLSQKNFSSSTSTNWTVPYELDLTKAWRLSSSWTVCHGSNRQSRQRLSAWAVLPL